MTNAVSVQDRLREREYLQQQHHEHNRDSATARKLTE